MQLQVQLIEFMGSSLLCYTPSCALDQAVYPKFSDFQRARLAVDPDGVFLSSRMSSMVLDSVDHQNRVESERSAEQDEKKKEV